MTAGLPERHASMARAVHGDPATRAGPRVRLIADLVCPWCYISFTRLRRLVAGQGAAILWHPFLLNPHLPTEGVTRSRYLERKFGSLAQAQRLYRRIQDTGAAEGIRFAFAAIRAQPNTVAAHAMVQAAAASGEAATMAEALYRAFFSDGADIGNIETLRAIVQAAGLPIAIAEAGTDALARAEVAAAHEQARGLGINGVPICLFGEDHLIAGAQPMEALEALLDFERYRLAEAQGRQAS